MTVHDFKKSLALSAEQADAPWWEEVYRGAFHNFAGMTCVRNDGWAQRGGIDRVIILESGKSLTVDEKVRAEDWPDILLEYYSSWEHRTPGWVAKDLACDYIAYAFIPSQTCYLLPFPQLRKAWRDNCLSWTKIHPRIEAKNEGYTTVACAVPIDALMAAISQASVIKW